ncbi:hypothetical protein CLV52_1687 [Amnibacterium kyonggiense]|uniref:Uncharacterized protein n=2 Tax=Amnibacterium kyonggiense TaxID=595671 RepID=A0A4R7FT93_9MICO|nr:hypothetical protein CLV52_1687 [Amnibacterium kyonggiense]
MVSVPVHADESHPQQVATHLSVFKSDGGRQEHDLDEWCSIMVTVAVEFVFKNTPHPNWTRTDLVLSNVFASSVGAWRFRHMHGRAPAPGEVHDQVGSGSTSPERVELLRRCLQVLSALPVNATENEACAALVQGMQTDLSMPVGLDHEGSGAHEQDAAQQQDQAPDRARRAQQGSRAMRRRVRGKQRQHPFPRLVLNVRTDYAKKVVIHLGKQGLRALRAAQRAGEPLPSTEVLAEMFVEEVFAANEARRVRDRGFIISVDANNPMPSKRKHTGAWWIEYGEVWRLSESAAAFAVRMYDPSRLDQEREFGRRGGLAAAGSHHKRFTVEMVRSVAHLSIAGAAAVLGCSKRTICARRAEIRLGEARAHALAVKAAAGRTRTYRATEPVALANGLDTSWLDRMKARQGGREAWLFGGQQRARMGLLRT